MQLSETDVSIKYKLNNMTHKVFVRIRKTKFQSSRDDHEKAPTHSLVRENFCVSLRIYKNYACMVEKLPMVRMLSPLSERIQQESSLLIVV